MTFCFLILESNGVELYTCAFHIVLTKTKKMTPLLSESNESEIFDLEPVWPYSTEGNGRRYCKLYIFLKLIDSRLRPYMFQNNLSHFNFHPCTNFTPLFQGHVGETHFGRQNIRIQHIYIDKDKVVASFYANLLLD